MARYAAWRHLQPRIRQFFYLAPDELSHLPPTPDTSNPYFRIQGIKLWHDGSPYTGSMYIADPYLDSPLTRELGIAPHSQGAAMIPADALQALLKKYAADGWQVAIHSQGDQSDDDFHNHS